MKKVISKLTVLCMALSCFILMSVPVKADTTATGSSESVKTYEQLVSAVKNAINNSTITIDADLVVGDGDYSNEQDYGLDIKSGTVVIDLNGHTITMGAASSGNTATSYFFKVYNNAKLILVNSDTTKDWDKTVIRMYTNKQGFALVKLNEGSSFVSLDNLKLRVDASADSTYGGASVIDASENSGAIKELTLLGTKLSIDGFGNGSATDIALDSSWSTNCKLTIGGGAFLYANNNPCICFYDEPKTGYYQFYDCSFKANGKVDENYIGIFKFKPEQQTLYLSKVLASSSAKADGYSKTPDQMDMRYISSQLTISGSTAAMGASADKIVTTTGHFDISTVKKVTYSEHKKSYVESETAPTCTTKGETKYRCNDCGAFIVVEVAKLDHKMTKAAAVESTCIEKGHDAYSYCSVCKKYYLPGYENGVGFPYSSFERDLVPHTLKKVEAVAPTCTSTGMVEYYLCSTCKCHYTDATASKIITKAEATIAKLDHKYDEGKVTKEPEVGKEGEKQFVCVDCGQILVRALPAIEKKEETPVVVTPAPEVGAVLSDANKNTYKVTAVGANASVEYKAAVSKTEATVSVPAMVVIDGVTYKVTSIAANAFKGNTKLTKVTIGKNVQIIGNNAFKGCTSLKKITIPASVKKIGKSAFEGDKKLTTVTIKTTKLKDSAVGAKAFKGINAKAKVKVPASKLKAYKKFLKKKGLSGKNQKITK